MESNEEKQIIKPIGVLKISKNGKRSFATFNILKYIWTI